MEQQLWPSLHSSLSNTSVGTKSHPAEITKGEATLNVVKDQTQEAARNVLTESIPEAPKPMPETVPVEQTARRTGRDFGLILSVC